MSHLRQSIAIAAPPARVFAFIAGEPEQMPHWWGLFEAQTPITPPPVQVGSTAYYVYNMMGVRIKGEHQVVALEDDAYLMIQTLTGIDCAFEFSFDPMDDGGTYLTVSVEYALPGAVLGQVISRPAIEQANERELSAALARLKALVESAC